MLSKNLFLRVNELSEMEEYINVISSAPRKTDNLKLKIFDGTGSWNFLVLSVCIDDILKIPLWPGGLALNLCVMSVIGYF